ncbi:MAG: Tetratricopeptide repeat protein [Myxococcales bacterium]|nr:Tetratricopeptide repeat protein [Myxococcales bacterium]
MRVMPSGLVLALALAACGGHAGPTTTLPKPADPGAPARDLAEAKHGATAGDPKAAQLSAKDPRVVDLDIIRITANMHGATGDPEMEHVATADLFKQANAAAKEGQTERALALYRQILSEFPDSQFAPVSMFNIAAIYDGRGDLPTTIATLRELVKTYPHSRESIEGHLYLAALQADHEQFAEANTTLDELLVRADLTYTDRIEGFARKGYSLIELRQYSEADAALSGAVAEWRKAAHIEDPYYIAMAQYYRGELAHRRFTEAPVRLPDAQLIADLETKRVLAVEAYDRWKDSLGFRQAYWATASGYQMSQIFVELWQATVTAPYPRDMGTKTRPQYVVEVHNRVREHLEKALEGHRMNVELAKAYGVDTQWSKGSEQQVGRIMETLRKETAGDYLTPLN